MRHLYKLLFVFTLSATLPASAQEMKFDIPAPDTSVLTNTRLWATYYHIWRTTESAQGIPLLDKNNQPLTKPIKERDWCMGAIEGTILLVKRDGTTRTYNYRDKKGTEQVDCSKVLNISPIKKSWITSTGKSRFRVANGTYGDGVLNYRLIPYRTIAVDPSVIPYGSVIYIPQARGVAINLPSGAMAVHDGFFYAADTGGAIKGNHIDVFAGVSRPNPFPAFVKSSDKNQFDAFLISDAAIKNRLETLHRQ